MYTDKQRSLLSSGAALMVDPLTLEPRIRAIGAQLAGLSAGHAPALFDSRWWSQATLNLAMKDPVFKAQLFRFIDVLPALKQDAQVIHMAREYFGEMGEQIFGLAVGTESADRDQSGSHAERQDDSTSGRANGENFYSRFNHWRGCSGP